MKIRDLVLGVSASLLLSIDGWGQAPSYGDGNEEPAAGRPAKVSADYNPPAILDSEILSPVPGFAQFGAAQKPFLPARMVTPEQFGAVGDCVADDTAALQAALREQCGAPKTVRLSACYRKTQMIVADCADTTLSGVNDATIYSVINDSQFQRSAEGRPVFTAGLAVKLAAPNTSIQGVRITSNIRERPAGNGEGTGIWLDSTGHRVWGNRLEYVNIFAKGAKDYDVVKNVVYRSLADGVHQVGRCSSSTQTGECPWPQANTMDGGAAHPPTDLYDGKVIANIMVQCGDDGVAVVDHGKGAPSAYGLLIAYNVVFGSYWGRGIAVDGGNNILIRYNVVQDIAHGAGILVHSEPAQLAANATNVTVDSNFLLNIQTLPAAWTPPGWDKFEDSGHAAIDVKGPSAAFERTLGPVIVSNNYIELSQYGGVRVRGKSRVNTTGNSLVKINGAPYSSDSPALLGVRQLCERNTLDNVAYTKAPCR